jgi:hypothetical protein
MRASKKKKVRVEGKSAAPRAAARKSAVGAPPHPERSVATTFLRARGITVSLEDMERMVVAAVEDMPKVLLTDDPSKELTEAERNALLEGGLDPTPRGLGPADPLARTAAEYAAILKCSKTVAETAKLLGVSEGRVRKTLNSVPPRLYGLKLKGEWRVPDFIFDGAHLVPGIEEVASRLRPELHPVGFYRWFTMPDPDLSIEEGDEEKPLSPRLWLLSGHPVEVVAELAAGL